MIMYICLSLEFQEGFASHELTSSAVRGRMAA